MSLTRARDFAVSLLGFAACAGCMPFASSRSAVADGRYYAAGNPDYDAFFLAVHAHQVELLHAPEQEQAARGELARAVVIADSASGAELAAKTKLELESFLGGREADLKFTLMLPSPPDPEHSMALISTSAELEARGRALVQTAQSSLSRLARLSAALELDSRDLTALREKVPSLEARSDSVFAQDRKKRAEVNQNLRDAERVIVLMLARASETKKPTDDLLSEFTRAFAHDSHSAEARAREPAAANHARPSSDVARRPPPRAPRPRDENPALAHQKPELASKKSADFEP